MAELKSRTKKGCLAILMQTYCCILSLTPAWEPVGEGDIGKHFPDTDPEFKDADSFKLLQHVWGIVKQKGYVLGNIDCTIIAQKPKMLPYIEDMRKRIAEGLEADVSQVNVKATTTEKLGFTGRAEGIAAQATVLIQKG